VHNNEEKQMTSAHTPPTDAADWAATLLGNQLYQKNPLKLCTIHIKLFYQNAIKRVRK